MKALLLCLTLTLISNTLFAQCGVERWDVKTLTDPSASSIPLTVKQTTIHEQVTLKRPKGNWLHMKRQPSESQQLVLTGTLIAWGIEDDNDYHLILQDTEAETIVCEIPDPDCKELAGSEYADSYRIARKWITDNVGLPGQIKPVPRPITLTVRGIGFWEKRNHGKGHAANGREIHPVYKVE